MAKAGDVLAAMHRNPAGDWSIEDIRRVCERRGFQCLEPSRGAHWKVAAPGRSEILSIPALRPIKPFTIRKFVAMCDETDN